VRVDEEVGLEPEVGVDQKVGVEPEVGVGEDVRLEPKVGVDEKVGISAEEDETDSERVCFTKRVPFSTSNLENPVL
jgi:acyl-[acyl carrier protein]--UDP-N-acetylglucosamine O-acyltransferase